jgi:hypothetical protein
VTQGLGQRRFLGDRVFDTGMTGLAGLMLDMDPIRNPAFAPSERRDRATRPIANSPLAHDMDDGETIHDDHVRCHRAQGSKNSLAITCLIDQSPCPNHRPATLDGSSEEANGHGRIRSSALTTWNPQTDAQSQPRVAHSPLSIPHARATSCRVSTCRQVNR